MIRFFSWDGQAIVPCEWSEPTAQKLLRISLSTLGDRYGKTGWQLLSIEDGIKNLAEDDTSIVFVGALCLAISIGQPWYSAEPVLYEDFVDEGIPLSTVVSVMEYAAKQVAIDRILVGTRAAPNQRHAGLAKLYTQEGMTVSTVELMKVVQ